MGRFTERRAVCRSSSWLHRFTRASPAVAAIAGAAAVAQAVAGSNNLLPPIAMIGLALFAVAAGAVAAAGGVIEAWLDNLGQAFDAASEGQLVVAADGGAVQTNIAFERLFPGAAEAALGRVDRAAADDAAAAFRALGEQAAAGAHAFAASPLQPADPGQPRRFEVSVEPARGRWKCRQWTFRDTGDCRRQGPIRAEPCVVLADLLDQTTTGFYSLDSQGCFVAVNRTLAHWLGVSVSEILESRAKLADFLAVSPSPAATPWDPVGITAEPREITLRTRRGDPIEVRIAQSLTGSGAALRVHGVLHLSALQRTRDFAVAQSRGQLQRFFANAPVGIAVVDRSGRFINANRALGELFGTAPETLIGSELIGSLNPDDRQAVTAKLIEAGDGREDRSPVEIRLAPPSERTMVMLLSRYDPSADNSATITGYPASGAVAPAAIQASASRAAPDDGLTLYFADVTEQRRLQRQFAQSQKMQAVGQLAGGVAHDFNNLLTAMIGFCDLLLLRSRPGDPTFGDLMQIKQNANRAANLVRQLLAFSRQQSLQPRVLDITDVLAELSHLLRRLIGENIDLEFTHGRDLGLVKVDQGQLEQVVINLAVNARDAMPDGGRLSIRTENSSQPHAVRRGHEIMPAGDYVLIEVGDTGIGIAPDNLARIFEPFFSTKEVGSGTGLGLSTVYGIVKQTGGFVFVESVCGAGARFSIYLPRHQVADGAKAAPPDTAEPVVPRDLTGTGTIMFVEDDDGVRTFGARALRNKGYRVVETKSGEAALKLIESASDPINLLITDIVMPRMDGPALIREVRKVDPGIKVIFISGYAEDAFRQRLDSDDDIDFLPKPFSLKQLALKVKDVMGSDFARSQLSDCVIEQNEYTWGPASRCTAAAAVK